MPEKHPIPIDRSPASDSDWPTLFERLLDDVSRVLRAEVQLLQSKLISAIQPQVSNALILLTIVGMIICGAQCILCAAILLLHQWFPLWQAFAIAGLSILVIAFVIRATTRPRHDDKD